MQGTYLKFYVQEKHRHHGILAYEWLLEEAKKAASPAARPSAPSPGSAATASCTRNISSSWRATWRCRSRLRRSAKRRRKACSPTWPAKSSGCLYIKLPLEMGVVGGEP